MSSTPEGAKPAVHERLRRLLFLVPFVAKNPGLTVEEVAKALGISKDSLLEELELLTMVGRPPFQPDDYIDIYVDEEEKVFVDLDQNLSRPPRLTAAEGVALAAAAELLRPAAADALSSALKKLERVLPEAARERYQQMARQLDLTLEAPDGLATLSQAIVENREVTFDYFSAGRGQTESRRVQPREVFSHRGQWYLQAYCLTRAEERLFRLDRINALKSTPTRFQPPDNPVHRSEPPPNAQGEEVRVRFSAAVAPYVQERFGDARWVPGQPLEVRVPGDSARWLTRWVLSFGGEAQVLEPQWAREAVAEAAAVSLEQKPI